jgi:hypothetical protein
MFVETKGKTNTRGVFDKHGKASQRTEESTERPLTYANAEY